MHLPAPARHLLEVLVVLAAVALGLLSLRTPTPPGQAAAADRPATPAVVVITGGALDAQTVERAAATVQWRGSAIVHPGAGIGRAPVGEKPLAVAVRSDRIDPDARMVLVQGGESLIGTSSAAFEVAAFHLVDYLKAYKPGGAILVLAGPIPPPSGPSETMVKANKIMRFVARQRAVRYIDAIEMGWSTGGDLSDKLGEQIVTSSKPRTFPPPLPTPPTLSPSVTPTATISAPARRRSRS